MLFMFPGSIKVEDLDNELSALGGLLRRERMDYVDGLQVSFLGWRDGERCQIVDKDDLISQVVFERSTDSGLRVPRPGVTIRDRPSDLEFNPIAIMLNRDD